MSQKELCVQMLDNVPDYKLGYVIAFLQGLTIDETVDDAFCMQMVERYENNTSPDKHDYVTLEDLAADLAATL